MRMGYAWWLLHFFDHLLVAVRVIFRAVTTIRMAEPCLPDVKARLLLPLGRPSRPAGYNPV